MCASLCMSDGRSSHTMSCAKTDGPVEMPFACGLGRAQGTIYFCDGKRPTDDSLSH